MLMWCLGDGNICDLQDTNQICNGAGEADGLREIRVLNHSSDKSHDCWLLTHIPSNITAVFFLKTHAAFVWIGIHELRV